MGDPMTDEFYEKKYPEQNNEVIDAQGYPVRGKGPAIINLVLDDIAGWNDSLKADFIRRSALGEFRYGYPLQAFNGRDALTDAYQEVLDLVLYMRQYIEESLDDDLLYKYDLYDRCIDTAAGLHELIKERKEKK